MLFLIQKYQLAHLFNRNTKKGGLYDERENDWY